VPDLAKRGAIRSVFDGRYTYGRYFSPKQHNRPASLEQIRAFNDVELYDAEAAGREVSAETMKGF